jgi:hypothetical protein
MFQRPVIDHHEVISGAVHLGKIQHGGRT